MQYITITAISDGRESKDSIQNGAKAAYWSVLMRVETGFNSCYPPESLSIRDG
jgi:hypothetical protein